MIFINGKIADENKGPVNPLSEAFLYGFGLFETVKVLDGKMIFLKEHLERLKKGSSVLKLEFIYKEDDIEEYCYDIINRDSLINGAIRISYSKNINDYYLLISTRENNYKKETYKKGFKLCFSTIKRNPYSPLVYVKSNNYLENILARRKAVEHGFDEAVFVNIFNKVCEGSISNIFFIKDKIIYTPDTNCGILSGILRKQVINLIDNLNIKICTGEYESNDLYKADEIFITNSLMDIMPVCQLEDKKFNMKTNTITRLLIKELKYKIILND